MRSRVMFKKLAGVIVLAAGLFGAQAVHAGLLTISVSSSGVGTSQGDWYLTGPSVPGPLFAQASYDHTGLGAITQTWDVNLIDGDYFWEIAGFGLGVGLVEWSLAYNNQEFYSGDKFVFIAAKIKGDTAWTETMAVPEPGTLALFGLGLLGLGAARRFRNA